MWRASPSARKRRSRRFDRAHAEADAYPGPSLVIAYSHCIAHGYDLAHSARTSKSCAVDVRRVAAVPLRPRAVCMPVSRRCTWTADSPKIKAVNEYMRGEARFRMARKIDPKRFDRLLGLGSSRWREPRRYSTSTSQLAGSHITESRRACRARPSMPCQGGKHPASEGDS